MKISFKHLLVALAVILVGHIGVVVTGLYARGVGIDKPLHIIGGLIFGIIWILILQRYFQSDSKELKAISIILFAVLGGVIWEFFEVALLVYFNDLALVLQIWSSTVLDALLDIAYGMLGATLLAYLYYKRHK